MVPPPPLLPPPDDPPPPPDDLIFVVAVLLLLFVFMVVIRFFNGLGVVLISALSVIGVGLASRFCMMSLCSSVDVWHSCAVNNNDRIRITNANSIIFFIWVISYFKLVFIHLGVLL